MSAVSVASRAGLATILLFSLITIALAGAPALPCEFYGTVTIGGSPAPVGTIVVAKLGDQERGQFVLEKDGTLGGSGTFDKRLKVVAEDSDLSGGTPKVSFWIDGQKASPESSFTPGTSNEVTLSLGGDSAAVKASEPSVSPAPSPAAKPVQQSSEPTVRVTAVPISLPPSPDPSIPVMPLPEKQPVTPGEISADFSSDIQSGSAPLTVHFKDLSSGQPTMWSWDFGDGKSDMIADPVHAYEKEGTYTVTLTVSSQNGGTDTKTKSGYITVAKEGKLVADFTADPTTGKSPLMVHFRDTSSGMPGSWKWDFGDGQTDTKKDPIHQYDQPGTYTVSLMVKDAHGAESSKQKDAYITVLVPGGLEADFSAEPTNGIAPLNVKFTDKSQGSPTLWSWDFGDGKSDLVANPVHVFDNPGNYTVTLTVTNQEGAISTKVLKEYVKAKVEPTPVPTLTVVPVPQVPETFYGTVELYGQPITVGGTVEARATSYNISGPYNPIKTAKGVFGKTGTFSPKMQIQGIPAGTELEFYVADESYSQLRAYVKSENGTLLWTIPYEPGKEKSIDLVATGRQPDVIPTIPVTPIPTSSCPGVPSIPMTFSGDVHITTGDEYLLDNSSCENCDPNGAVGTVIEARIDGYDVSGSQNPITMSSLSYFGGGNSSWSDKLALQGRCVPEGSNITFWVMAPNWQVPAPAFIRDGSTFIRDVTYGSSTENEGLHLWVGAVPTVKPTVTPTPTPEAWSPQKFYGKAEFNGYPLRVGDRVMATTEGVDLNSPTNPISSVQFGEFGDPGGNEMLTVEVPYTALNQSDPITFWIKPQGFEYWYKARVKNPLSTDTWKQSYPFTPGSITNLQLTSTDREEFRYFYDIVTNVKNVIMPDDYTGW
ncbi:MAG TPA: PKD domain-containing protein [Methanospirillum sp.]|uniref:PKD domain-containing protein n=1 Tax=Methanospirillum sp. TaxID=45200 RepID=UPI002C4645CF|nr:PKD domain-containing protein [Methanospirillum sp.]HWQ63491.1 PKD domain-containing protein [Methanospirillum sp.]